MPNAAAIRQARLPGIESALKNMSRVKATYNVRLLPKSTQNAILNSGVLASVITEFFKAYVAPLVSSQFEAAAAGGYAEFRPHTLGPPRVRTGTVSAEEDSSNLTQLGANALTTGGFNIENKGWQYDVGRVVAGFNAVKQLFLPSKLVVQDDGKGNITAGLGKWSEALAMHSLQYMPFETKSTNSPLTTWFFNVEFGTGIARNVGGQQWVNLKGDYKITSGPWAGSWFLSGIFGKGALMRGQKGLNLFFDPTSRVMHRRWQDLFTVQLPKYLTEAGLYPQG